MKRYKVEVEPPPEEPRPRFRLHYSAIAATLLRYLLRRFVEKPAAFIITGGLLGVVLVYGTPHIGWNYTCRTADCSYIYYCDYYGIFGKRVERPGSSGRCGLIRFLPLWS